MTDLTPPVKAPAAPAPKAATPVGSAVPPKAATSKAPKAPKVAKPRGSYGYHVDSKIEVVKGKEVTYKGQRAEWFGILKMYDGKKVSDFNAATKGKTNGKGTAQTPSGWLRFFALDGAVKLIPPVEAPKPAEAPKAA